MNNKNIEFTTIPLFHKIIKDPILIERVDEHFFDKNTGIYVIYELIRKNPKCWNNVTATQIKSIIKEKNLQIDDSIIDNIMNNKSIEEIDPKWLDEKFKSRLLYKDIEAKLIEGQQKFKLLDNDISFDNLSKFFDKYKESIVKTSFSTNEKWNNISKGIEKETVECLKTGYPIFDNWKAIRKKRTTCFMGKTNGGKTASLIAISASLIKSGYKIAYISFEVEQSHILTRLLSQLTNKSISEIENLSKSETAELWNSQCSKYKEPEIFYDSYQSYTSSNLLSEILNREAIVGKFDAIIVDYLSIIDSPEEDIYSKGKKISQAFANYSKSYNWAIITAAQTNRGGLQKIILSSEDIAESAAVLHTFDFVISIIHYKRMIKNKAFAWDLIKARYVNENYIVGSKTSFTVNWINGGIFTENTKEKNTELIKQINVDDRSGTFEDVEEGDSKKNPITAKEYKPSFNSQLFKISGEEEFK